MANTIQDYMNGGEGFISWCEDFVYQPITIPGTEGSIWIPMSDLPHNPNPFTGRSYYDMWQYQKDELVKAFAMQDGQFVNRLIVFCWPRGDGKSAIACLGQTWKFICFPKQQIVLGANSKEQTKFVHFDIIRDIIINSPKLLKIVGRKNIQEKDISLRIGGNILSTIRPISSFSGIVSNITGFTFSEMFDMKNPKFYNQLAGSTRNIPNALGIIDSTVSVKGHILHDLYQAFMGGKIKKLFFSYRYSLEAKQEDYWHPNQDEAQLEFYRGTMTPNEFSQYFKNLWETGVKRLFSDAMIEGTNFIGVDGMLGGDRIIQDLLEKKHLAEKHILEDTSRGIIPMRKHHDVIKEAEMRLNPLSQHMSLTTAYGYPQMAPPSALDKLGVMYKTDWAISVGLDRSDPLKNDPTQGANTILTVVAKGLPGSKGMNIIDIPTVPNYIYILLHLKKVESSDLNDIKTEILGIKEAFDGVDSLGSERWGVWDMVSWCEANEIKLEIISTSYDTQKTEFAELFLLYSQGRFKAPPLSAPGVKSPDILKEEAAIFDHDVGRKWYGSPEKNTRNGIQDDAIYSLAHAIYSGRELNITHFRSRTGSMFWGQMIGNPDNIAKY